MLTAGVIFREKEIFYFYSLLFDFVTRKVCIMLIIKQKLNTFFEEKRLCDLSLNFTGRQKGYIRNISKLTQKALTHWMETKGKEEEEIKDDTDSWSPDAWKVPFLPNSRGKEEFGSKSTSFLYFINW